MDQTDYRQILIDLPVVFSEAPLPNQLCLARRGSAVAVASNRFLVILDYGEAENSKLPQVGEVWLYRSFMVGTDKTLGLIALPQNAGKNHLTIMLKKRITLLTDYSAYLKTRTFDGQPIQLLSSVLRNAPRFDRPGGSRGKTRGYRRGVKVGELWLTREAQEILKSSLGKRPGKGARMKYLSDLILQADKRL